MNIGILPQIGIFLFAGIALSLAACLPRATTSDRIEYPMEAATDSRSVFQQSQRVKPQLSNIADVQAENGMKAAPAGTEKAAQAAKIRWPRGGQHQSPIVELQLLNLQGEFFFNCPFIPLERCIYVFPLNSHTFFFKK